MDPDEITKFFQQVMEQLGPTAQRTFQIVGQRVAAESMLWLIVGLIFIAFSLIYGLCVLRWYPRSTNNDKQPWALLHLSFITTLTVIGIGLAVSSAIVLNSLEYSTIERILNLVGGSRR